MRSFISQMHISISNFPRCGDRRVRKIHSKEINSNWRPFPFSTQRRRWRRDKTHDGNVPLELGQSFAQHRAQRLLNIRPLPFLSVFVYGYSSRGEPAVYRGISSRPGLTSLKTSYSERERERDIYWYFIQDIYFNLVYFIFLREVARLHCNHLHSAVRASLSRANHAPHRGYGQLFAPQFSSI